MKVLIWFLCCFVYALITTLIERAGVMLGAIRTAFFFGVTCWLAQKFCRKWDEYQKNKVVVQEDSDQNVGHTVDLCFQPQFCGKCGEKLLEGAMFCRKCGTKIVERVPVLQDEVKNKTMSEGDVVGKPFASKKYENKLVSITNLLSIVFAIISVFAIIVALNMQDVRRNNIENWNPTVVYFVLLFLLGAFLFAAIYARRKRRIILPACLSAVTVVAVIITGIEGSVLSSAKYLYRRYINSEIVAIFNVLWIVFVSLIFVVTSIPICIAVFKYVRSNWYQSSRYREKCYNRVAKMHTHLENGIITEEEYEKVKKDILKHIQ